MARKVKPIEPARGLFPRGGRWWCRVVAPGCETQQRSTGAPIDDVQKANDIKAMLATLERQRHFKLLQAANAGTMSLDDLYARFISNDLEGALATANDVDLSPWVEKWERAMRARPTPPEASTINNYVRQVRTLMPKGEPFPSSTLTRKAAKAWLESLAADGLTSSTCKRYGAALKVFAGWLLEEDVLSTNPLADWTLPADNPERKVWWTWDVLRSVLAAMPDGAPGTREEQEKLCVTLIASTGMELGAAVAVCGHDINHERHMMHAHGTKTDYRDRWVHVRKWGWGRLGKYGKQFLYGAPLFPLLTEGAVDTLRDHFYDAQVAVGRGTKTYDAGRRHTDYDCEHTLHDLRHTFCYLAFTGEDGDRKQGLHYVKRQLGHKDLVMGQRIYANFNLGDEAIDDAVEQLQDTGT